MKPGIKALAAGATAGLLMSSDSFANLMALRAIDDIGVAISTASAISALLAGGVAVGLSRLSIPLAPSRQGGWIAAAVMLVLSLSGLPFLSNIALPVIVGYGLGIYTATLLPENAGMGRRLAVAFGGIGALFGATGALAWPSGPWRGMAQGSRGARSSCAPCRSW